MSIENRAGGHLQDVAQTRTRLDIARTSVHGLRNLDHTQYGNEILFTGFKDGAINEVTLHPSEQDINHLPLSVEKVFKDLYLASDLEEDVVYDPASIQIKLHDDQEFDVTYARIGDEPLGVTLSTTPDNGALIVGYTEHPFFPNPDTKPMTLSDQDQILFDGYSAIAKGENPVRIEILEDTTA